MTQQAFPDEVLMAYADGELDAKTSRAVEEALAEDSALAERLKIFTGTGAILKRAASERGLDPVPDGLMTRVNATLDAAREAEQKTVVPFPSTARPRWHPIALAASILLAIGLGAGWVMDSGQPAPTVVLLETEGLDQALSDLRSGETRILTGGEAHIIASFLDADGILCREYELNRGSRQTFVSVACHTDAGWQTRLAIATASGDGQSYVPASSIDTLEAYLVAIGASSPLSAEAESNALHTLPRGD